MNRRYFDHNATTPVAESVAARAWPMLCQDYGNASSIHHYGQRARQALETAREQVAAMLGANAREVVILSGGTEADNLALFGTMRVMARERRHLVTTTIEHPAVLASCARLEREGVEVTRIEVGPGGVVDPGDVRRALRPPHTALVSVMHANNELGTVQPIAEIAAIAHQAGALFHSDGVQAAGKLAVNVHTLGVDLYSISGHKIYAPKGVGALYVRTGLELDPLLYGGRHEMGRRAGTESVFLAAALGFAAEECHAAGDAELSRLAMLRDRLERGILARVPNVTVNCAGSPRVPNTTNLRFDGVTSEALVIALDLKGFAVSGGAACSSGAVEPSHVLLAIGLDRDQARSSVRFSLGRSNTSLQVDELIDAVTESVAHLRRLSPVYCGGAP